MKKDIIWQKSLADRKNTFGKSPSYLIRPLGEDDFDGVMELHDIMFKSLAHPDFFRPPIPELVMSCLSDMGLTLGIFTDDRLVALRMTYIPGKRPENHGNDIGLDEEELPRVAQFEGIVVHPGYQRRGLGTKIMAYSLPYIRETGLRYVIATCHPDNYPAVRIFLSYGFLIKKLGRKYSGLTRYFVYKDVEADPPVPLQEEIPVDHGDLDTQSGLLGKGYTGVSLVKTPEGYSILYGR